MGSVMTELMNG